MSEFEKAVTGLGEECGVFGAYDVDGQDVALQRIMVFMSGLMLQLLCTQRLIMAMAHGLIGMVVLLCLTIIVLLLMALQLHSFQFLLILQLILAATS